MSTKKLTINSVRSFDQTNSTTGVVTSKVVINPNDESPVYLSAKQMTNAGYRNPKGAIGCELTVTYYNVDELLLDGKSKCTKPDMLVKSFSIEDSAEDLRLAKMANAGVMVKL